jgi:hypothetical protein
MYQVAPIDTWAIIAQEESQSLAFQIIEAFKQQIPSLDPRGTTRAPRIFLIERDKTWQ